MKTRPSITERFRAMLPLLLLPLFLILFSVPAFAAETNIKKVTVTVKDLYENGAGVVSECSVGSSACTYIESVNHTAWPAEPGKSVTLTIVITPASGYKFTKSGDSKTTVTVNGATLSSSSFQSIHQLTVRVSYTTKMTLAPVDPDSFWIAADGTTIHWDAVKNAPAYELKLGGVSETITVSGKNYVNLKSRLTKDIEDTSIKIRAVPKTEAQKKYLVSSSWTSFDGTISVEGENTVSGSFTGKLPTLRFRTVDEDTNSTCYASGWQYIRGSWYYFDPANHDYARTGWLLDRGVWYYLDPSTAAMKTGWVQLPYAGKNTWFFLSGSGAMATGWIQDTPGGKWYYLDPSSGAMWYNATTPDGYRVGPDGAWIQ